MSDSTERAGRGWPTMPYSTRSPKDSERYRRFNELRAQTGDTMAAAMLLIRETDWTPVPRVHRELACGCSTNGTMCQRHAPHRTMPWPVVEAAE